MVSDPASRAGAILEIDLGGIVENWRLLAAAAMPAACAAVVKANAYGLGAVPVARALVAAGCRMLFVATLDEGIALRQAVGGLPKIAVFNGPLCGTAAEFAAHRLIPVLNDPGQIEQWASLPGGHPAILHVDTGMARLGLTDREFETVIESRPAIAWHAVISHLACADSPGHTMNAAQRTRFAAAAARLPGVSASLAASCGVFLGRPYHFDLVRPGAALYGVNPCPGRPNPLRQVVRLSAKILQIRQIDSGQSVGYGAAHVMEAPGRIATVAVGYADGWPRALGRRGCGHLAGVRVPLIGRVSMDLVTFDVSAVDPALACPGMMIELLGDAYRVDDAASDAGTIGYEILCRLGARYHRVYRDLLGTPLPANPPG
ncbi:MAG TPA: alanine racemase [Stellaceae bacterium]|nr:alanine racemase [Stellaceae bacterium]